MIPLGVTDLFDVRFIECFCLRVAMLCISWND